jgi:CRP-like cAMP-binding protein
MIMNTINGTKNDSMPVLAAAIGSHRFTAGMKPEHLQKMADVAMFKQFKPGEIIFRESEPANRFYLICRGKVALASRVNGESSPPVQYLGEGDVLGWSWLFPPFYWHFSATATEPTEAIFFYGTRLREESEEDPVFGYELMKRMAAVVIKRLQITRVQLLRLQQQ